MLAVRGDFGDGKSAFLRMCVAHLRNQETPVVEFNAWLQGHTEDPLRDLISVLSNDLDRPQALQDLLRKIATRGIGKVTGGLVEPEDFERQTAAVVREWDDLNMLRKRVQSTLAETVRDRNGKLVVLIDELDRCLPKYALGVLNAARNLLDTPGVVVVLGLNPRETAARIRQLYGSTTEAETFLGRFVDYSIDLRLPNAETGGMDQFLDGVSAFANTDAWVTASDGDYTDLMIKVMVDRFGLSLRDTQQLVHRVAVSLRMLATTRYTDFSLQALLSLLALRVGAPSAYRELVLDGDSVFDAALALSHKLAVTQDDHVGLRMIALLIIICVGGFHKLTFETFSEAMTSPDQPRIEPQVIEQLWAHLEPTSQQWFGRPASVQEFIDLIELAK